MRIIFIFFLSLAFLRANTQISKLARPKELIVAQTDTLYTDSLPKITIIGKYSGKEIKIKWAPSNFEFWERYNKYGYTLSRIWNDTVGNGSKGYEIMNPNPLLPWPFDKFKQHIKLNERDDYVAVVGQCLYGETDKTRFESWTDALDDKQNRLMFTLLSTEFSPMAAEAAGLSFIDNDIAPDRFYRYRLIGNGNGPKWRDTVYLDINTFTIPEIPEPFISESKVDKGYIVLGWDRQSHNQFFSGYYIERSLDGVRFTRMNKKPYINPETDVTSAYDLITWKDTLVFDNEKYYYRIIGINSYAELSNPSNTVMLKIPDKTPPSQPVKVVARHLGGTRVEITWNHTGNESDLAGFMVGRSRVSHEGFENVSGEKPLPRTARKFIDENCSDKTTNFYIVAAVDTAGNASASLVSFASILDSIPPVKPKNLQGKIDTNGVVTLTWPLGPENDIKGYLVHFTNDRTHTFTCLTGEAVNDTIWRDTISLLTLTKKIYYRIQAVDVVDNASVFSDILELSKPDIVPPVKPFIHDYQVEVGKISMTYQPSTSSDVEYHMIRRKSINDLKWVDVKRIDDRKAITFIDDNVEESSEYWYTMVAVDSIGNTSEQATAIHLKTLKDLRNPLINVKAELDTLTRTLTLSWQDIPKKKYKEIIIYKSVNKGPVLSQTRVNVSPNEINKYIEKHCDPKQNYEFTTKVVYEKGVTSGFGPMVEAKQR